MNDCIYRDFDIAVLPAADDTSPNPALPSVCVTLTQRATGASSSFYMHGVLCGMDRLLELHVRNRFPGSGAALELERKAGAHRFRLGNDWRSGLGRKVNLALLSLCDSPGATFWWHQLESMHQILLLMMYRRTEEGFERLNGIHTLREFADTMRSAWAEVLADACGLDGWRDVKLTELHRKGWPIARLENQPHSELAAISQRARLAHMALSYLSEQDWQKMLGYVLVSCDNTRLMPRKAHASEAAVLEALLAAGAGAPRHEPSQPHA
ncbi:hypothetical protein G3A43_08600 [Paraburkholderia aspalathi]|nr:hypothetical protein [Paraburkholderia aspalathi]MBK3780316.1 hypothetical protein [Paraburkholderia aspalathi]